MCFLRPLKIKAINKTNVTLDNGLRAYYDVSIGKLAIGDPVLVYGNVIIEKAETYEVPESQ